MDKCTNCEEEDPINRCEGCEEYLCLPCSDAHKRAKKTKEHILKALQLNTGIQHTDESHLFQHKGLESLLSEIKKSDTELLQKQKETLDNEQEIKEKIKQHFDYIVEEIRKKQKKLENDVKAITQNRQSLIEESINKLGAIQAETINLQSDIKNRPKDASVLNAFIKTNTIKIEELVPHFDNIVLSGINPVEDLNRMVESFGRVQSGIDGAPATAISQLTRQTSRNNGAVQTHVMTVFKKPSFENDSRAELQRSSSIRETPIVETAAMTASSNGTQGVAASGFETQGIAANGVASDASMSASGKTFNHSIIPDTFVLNNVHPPASMQDVKPNILEESPERSRMYGHEQVQTAFADRLITNGLDHCKLEIHDKDDGQGKRTVLYTRTAEEANQCMRLLRELVFEKSVKVKDTSMNLLDSDKWLMLTRAFKQKFADQVAFEIRHTAREVICLSIDMKVLLNVVDGVRNFLHDHTTNSINMWYCKSLVERVANRKKDIKQVLTSYSQYLVEINFPSQDEAGTEEACISVSGIGCGLGTVVQRLHQIAQQCARGSDVKEESRFGDDDDDDEGELSRYKDTLSTELQMTLTGDETKLHCLCLPGTPRVLYIVNGNILQLPVEAVVNPADHRLKHDGGLARVIVNNGGRCIQEECTFHVSQNGNMSPGQVYVSTAGQLLLKHVFHAAGQRFKDGNQNEAAILTNTVRNVFNKAAEHGVVSLAIPAIGTGSFNYPVKVATNTIITAIKAVFNEKPTCVKEVYLCDLSDEAVNSFVDAAKAEFEAGDILVSDVVRRSHGSIVMLM